MPEAEAVNEPLSLTLSAESLNEIGLIGFEIWTGKVKSRGRVYSSRFIYSAKHGICGIKAFEPIIMKSNE